MQWASAASSKYVWSHCSSLCLCYISVLLFKHFGIILENIGEDRERHGDIEEKAKTSLFCLYIVNLGTVTGFFR